MNPIELKPIRALVIDADGVLWQGKQALPGVPEFFDFLRARQIKFVIATNNSARPSSDVVQRLDRMGAKISDAEVLTSAEATALYLPKLVPPGSRVYVIGGEGIRTQLTNAGFELAEENVAAVVMGIDWEVTYAKLKRATMEIRRGAKFVGTNGDKTFPMEDGIVPGAGALLAAVHTATDVAPTIVGKPERHMFDIAIEKMNVAREVTAGLGDRLDTDIEGAQRAGVKSILVFSGITTRDALAQSAIKPDWTFENLVDLREIWSSY
jgi:4-nitrophenyl phosphatase